MKMARDGEGGTWKMCPKAMIMWQGGFLFYLCLNCIYAFFRIPFSHRAVDDDTIHRQRFPSHNVTAQREIKIRKARHAVSVANLPSERNDWNVGVAQRGYLE